ncbi:hypothetical protein [Gorillibacterium sp. CAU 1737]|uniref:hypothetical protein n=1 Tax=Gorillibacterium sp. CAU 1737 TaxID=3140362 RepID=UPI003260F9ED
MKKIIISIMVLVVIGAILIVCYANNFEKTIKAAIERKSGYTVNDFMNIQISNREYYVIFNENNKLHSASITKNMFGYKLQILNSYTLEVPINSEDDLLHRNLIVDRKTNIVYGLTNNIESLTVNNSPIYELPLSMYFKDFKKSSLKFWYFRPGVTFDH